MTRASEMIPKCIAGSSLAISTVPAPLTVHPAPELYAALAAARAEGIVTLLVTGRVLEDVQRACEEFLPFDAVVARLPTGPRS
jgi:hypothetical protein